MLQNSGADLSVIADNTVSFAYCFDSMVHFDVEIIISYIKEFRRILKKGGSGFMHHSNYMGTPGRDFRQNPCWRNFMSKDLFAHLCIHNGLDVVQQELIQWGEYPDLDCMTTFVCS